MIWVKCDFGFGVHISDLVFLFHPPGTKYGMNISSREKGGKKYVSIRQQEAQKRKNAHEEA